MAAIDIRSVRARNCVRIYGAEPLIDIAKAQSELKPDKDMRLVGHIPLVIYNQMMRDGSFNDPAAIKKWLNNPDNKCFRVAPGRV